MALARRLMCEGYVRVQQLQSLSLIRVMKNNQLLAFVVVINVV